MNKRGNMWGHDWVVWMVRMVVVTGFAILIMMFQAISLNASLDVSKAEAELMITSMMFSPDGIVYTDNGRSYPGIIDVAKFTAEEPLEQAFYIPVSTEDYPPQEVKELMHHVAYNITLYNASMNIIDSNVFNPVWYHRWKVKARTGIPGSGGAFRVIRSYAVLLRFPDERLEPGFVKIDMVRPNQ